MLQGALDYEQCELVWGNDAWPQRIADWFLLNGVPRAVAEELLESGSIYRPFIRYQPDPELVGAGDRVDGWELVAAPGHATASSSCTGTGSSSPPTTCSSRPHPTVGLWPASRPDPLGDFLQSLETVVALDPAIALPGHGEAHPRAGQPRTR